MKIRELKELVWADNRLQTLYQNYVSLRNNESTDVDSVVNAVGVMDCMTSCYSVTGMNHWGARVSGQEQSLYTGYGN
jgi:hypothetical protein